MMARSVSGTPRVDSHRVIDGGDRACGELLLELVERMRRFPAGTVVRLVATDPAAPIDIPAWCHLTGHVYLGCGRQPDGRPHYDLEVSAAAAATRQGMPWRQAKPNPQPEGLTSP